MIEASRPRRSSLILEQKGKPNWSLQIEPARGQLVKMTTRSREKERCARAESEGQSLGPPMDEVGGRKVGRGECGRPIAHWRHLGMYLGCWRGLWTG